MGESRFMSSSLLPPLYKIYTLLYTTTWYLLELSQMIKHTDHHLNSNQIPALQIACFYDSASSLSEQHTQHWVFEILCVSTANGNSSIICYA